MLGTEFTGLTVMFGGNIRYWPTLPVNKVTNFVDAAYGG